MTDRTFHKRFSVPAKCGVAVFALLTGYFFWVKVAIIGILLAIVIVGMIERILNTTYTSEGCNLSIGMRKWISSSSMRGDSPETRPFQCAILSAWNL